MEPPEGRIRFGDASLNLAAGRIAVGYALLASLATALALALQDGVPWEHPEPWLALSTGVALGLSGGLGLALALILILATRVCVHRFGWARGLHVELRPVARGLTNSRIVLIAGFSSLGEELLFRGLLQPWLGLVLASLLFGVVHQLPGSSRWVWVAWATVVGFALGAIFSLTGSLLGSLVAHAVINAINLAYLRDHEPADLPS
ncbi:MAG: CPBP family intramembrane metalloprotease [Deltaproteobacteria bacterium]|jgi:membrane protease YdiL (CAAX protease family)|nr:CPBP family intramembrane metalloprotease [Deltaproteobacteria bacterium]MBW2535201.1 CPBP family intramembrane metalloprotease [Deltaproteobacteria bacterium]